MLGQAENIKLSLLVNTMFHVEHMKQLVRQQHVLAKKGGLFYKRRELVLSTAGDLINVLLSTEAVGRVTVVASLVIPGRFNR